ncbi:MAG: class I SAM-dependent methyltransferase [Myxococcales bacterium]|nr:class I SAM-dependent methyltransferase [Myxococcales bacterium]
MTLKNALTKLLTPRRETVAPSGGLRLDLGCGALKRAGTVGVDLVLADGVDHVLDFVHEPLPFATGSVNHVFSSHCIEHLVDPLPLFREISRVCADGAGLELWTPHARHNSSMLPEHMSYWTEEFYMHVSTFFPEHWRARLGASWLVDEVVFVITSPVQQKLHKSGFALDFAVDHLSNVVTEIGILARIDKSNPAVSRAPVRTYAADRAASDRGQRYPLDGGALLGPVRERLGSLQRSASRLIGL